MNIYKVLPKLDKQRHLNLWHKALRAQWSATDLDWDRPQRITSGRLKDELARLLTPALMSEQAALYSVSGMIPILGHQSEVESQFYLTTWAVDEARHTELFACFYGRLDREPMSIRRFPAGYLFQNRILSRDPMEWLAGLLVAEVLAQNVMESFRGLDLDPVLSDICDGILADESRHLGFNHIYFEDRFATLYATDEAEAESRSRQVQKRADHVVEGVMPILDGLAPELASVGIDRMGLFERVRDGVRRRLNKSIEAGRRVASHQAPATELSEAEAAGR